MQTLRTPSLTHKSLKETLRLAYIIRHLKGNPSQFYGRNFQLRITDFLQIRSDFSDSIKNNNNKSKQVNNSNNNKPEVLVHTTNVYY